jgi:hypothetical protein
MSSASLLKNDVRPRTVSRPAGQLPRGTPPAGMPATLSAAQILTEISRETQALMKTQVDLVKAELRADLSRETSMVKGFGVSALAALVGLNLLLVAGVLALADTMMPAWLAALVFTAVAWLVAAAAAVFAWHMRVRKPLEKSRNAIDQDVRWMKERLT